MDYVRDIAATASVIASFAALLKAMRSSRNREPLRSEPANGSQILAADYRSAVTRSLASQRSAVDELSERVDKLESNADAIDKRVRRVEAGLRDHLQSPA